MTQFLSVLFSNIESFLSNYKDLNTKHTSIKFVKAGESVKKSAKKMPSGLLHLAPDWKMLCDIDSKLVFPTFIAVTVLRPDLILYSLIEILVIILELTCPSGENMEQWHRTKFLKYEPLLSSIKSIG